VKNDNKLLIVSCLALSACGGGGGGGGGVGGGGQADPAPTIAAQSFSGTEDMVLSAQLVASDPGDTLTFAATTNPSRGTLVVSASGAITYTPAPDFFGSDTFSARVTDSHNQSSTATITLNVANTYDAPVPADDVLSVTSADALAVLANDSNPDGGPLAVTVDAPFIGTASVNASGVVSLALPTGFKGMTRFDYHVADSTGATAVATAVVFVGVAPFKALFQGEPVDSSAPFDIYVSDFLSTTRAHPDLPSGATVGQFRAAANGAAIAFEGNFSATGERQLWYVAFSSAGAMREVSGREPFGTVFSDFRLSPDGRYVLFQLHDNATGSETLWLFDAQGSTMAQRVTDPADLYQATQAAFDASGVHVDFVGREQLSQSTSTNAVYRMDVATRAITRLSPKIDGADGAIDSFAVTPDGTRVIASRALGSAIPRNIYVTDTAQPDVETLLHEPTSGADFTSLPVMSPDGTQVLFQVLHSALDPAQLRVGDPRAPGATTPLGSVAFQQAAYYSPSDRPFVMRADSNAALVTSDCPTNANPSGACALYEVSFASPATASPVASPSAFAVMSPRYSRDGLLIAYISRESGRRLEVTHRSSLGAENIPVTAEGDAVTAFTLDPDGYGALVEATDLSFVNLTAPLQTIPLALGFTTTTGAYALVPR
jgi:Tol biopolymer transport system component